MSLGRHAPCHCGSGRKYKQCCLDDDARRGRSLQLTRGGAATAPDNAPHDHRHRFDALDARTAWEIDAVPLPVVIAAEPIGRHCMLMVTAADVVLSADMNAAPPSEPEEIAQWYVTALTAVVATTGRIAPKRGTWPTKVWVRHAFVAALGAGNQVFGIALYGSDDDFMRMFRLDDEKSRDTANDVVKADTAVVKLAMAAT